MKQVQLVYDNYDILHNPKVKEKYPKLYEEVINNDRISNSSWCDLTEEAYKEYLLYSEDMEI